MSISRLLKIILLLLAAWMIFNLFQTMQWVITDYTQIPVSDYWRIPEFWPNFHAAHWSNLWRQHNEHRIIFPELIFIADTFLLHGRMYLPIILSCALYFGILAVLVFASYSGSGLVYPYREIALLLAGIVMAWKACSTQIATPFQLQFTLVQFASAIALLFLSRLAETGRLCYLLWVIAAGIVCTYTSANGMMMWLVLIAMGLALKVSLRHITILTAVAAVSIATFFIGYRFLPSQMSTNIRHPLLAFEFLCSYLSMPFGTFFSPSFGVTVGASNLLLMGACFWFLWREKSELGTLIFGMYLFTLISALLTTGGRMDLNDHQFAQAKALRYVTMPTVNWALLAIALVWLPGRWQRQSWSLAGAFLVAAFFAYGFGKSTPWVEATRQDPQSAQITATMLRNNLFEPKQIQAIFPDAAFVQAVIKTLSDNHQSIYSRGADKWLGQDLTQLKPESGHVNGEITRVDAIPGGLKILGWAETEKLTQDHAVLFVDKTTNRIVGFAQRPAAGMPPDIATWDTPNSMAFLGFVALKPGITKLSVYVRTRHGVSPMGTEIQVPLLAGIAYLQH